MPFWYKLQNAINCSEVLLASGLAIAAINRASNGHYQLAAVEGAAAVWVGADAYFGRERLNFLSKGVPELVQYAERVRKNTDRAFEDLFSRINKILENPPCKI